MSEDQETHADHAETRDEIAEKNAEIRRLIDAELTAAMAAADDGLRAKADMAMRFAMLNVPYNIQEWARAFGMQAFIELLWCSAFLKGYREAMRDRAENSDD